VAELFWILIVVVCVAVEIHTNSFVALFVGLSALVAFITALFGLPFVVQSLAWLALSVGSLIVVRPLALANLRGPRRHHLDGPATVPMSNQRGVVELTVGNEEHPGRVRIQGESWRAVTDWPIDLPLGTAVVVRKAYGTTLWVDPL
jgi:membrane protein implicated in regulation of membrane protease activity